MISSVSRRSARRIGCHHYQPQGDFRCSASQRGGKSRNTTGNPAEANSECENTGRNNGMKKLAIIAASALWISGLTAAYSQTPRTGTEPGNLPAEKPEPAAKIAEKTKTPGDAVIVWNANAGVAATKACIAPLDDPFHEARMYAMMHVARSEEHTPELQ